MDRQEAILQFPQPSDLLFLSMTNSTGIFYPKASWRVGFSGKRALSDEGKMRQSLDKVWNELRHRVDGDLEAYGSLAEGGDILFAESALEQNIPWSGLFPFDPEQFEKDIGATWMSRYLSIQSGAASIDVWAETSSKESAYYQSGQEVLESSEIFLVIWDGKPAQGLGGTAQMVEAARVREIPLVWIHSETGEIVYERFPDGPMRDETAVALRHFLSVSEQEIEGAMQPGKMLLEKLDAEASQRAPLFRSLASTNLIIHVVAILLALVGIKYGVSIGKTGYQIVSWTEAVLIAVAFGLVFYATRLHLHHRWIYLRSAAEIVRSVLSWGPFLPARQAHRIWASFPGFIRVHRSVRRLISQPQQTDWHQAREVYLDERVADQKTYYTKQTGKIRRMSSWLDRLLLIVVACATVTTLTYPILKFHYYPLNEWDQDKVAIGFLAVLAVALPLLSMLILSLKNTLDMDQRLSRFSEMSAMLDQAERRLRSCEDMDTFYTMVADCEHHLLDEVGEWYRRTRHIHIH